MNIIDTGAAAWLTYLPMEIPQGETTQDIARSELRAGLSSLGFAAKVDVIEDDKGEGFEITQSQDGYVIKGGKTGVLYGVYHFLSAIAREESPLTPFTAPHYPL